MSSYGCYEKSLQGSHNYQPVNQTLKFQLNVHWSLNSMCNNVSRTYLVFFIRKGWRFFEVCEVIFFLYPRSTHLRYLWFSLFVAPNLPNLLSMRKVKVTCGILKTIISRSLWTVKVHIFWEGHKILRNLPLTFDYSTYSQK